MIAIVTWQALSQELRWKVVEVQVDVVFVGANTTPFVDLNRHRTADYIAGRQVFRFWSIPAN